MAFEIPGPTFTVPASTGLKQFRAVKLLATNGYAAYPTAADAITGVIQTQGTTGSTAEPQYVGIMASGVTKMEAASNTLGAGDMVCASSVGLAVPSSAGDYVIGQVVGGSSGGAGRILSVLLLPIGTT